MSPVSPSKIVALNGRVVLAEYGKGSKSERLAFFFVARGTRYILRRSEGPAFDDKELLRYAGHEVVCDGFVIGTTLLADRIVLVG